ncbi:MAG: hypothetical protein M1836_005278 [Candelina mexicana]|nr:MAG: hypothetical protein M1836_005278 [Candelina mexicana]
MVSTSSTPSPTSSPAGQDSSPSPSPPSTPSRYTSPPSPTPLPLLISKFSSSNLGPPPTSTARLRTIFTTFTCGHRTTDFLWITDKDVTREGSGSVADGSRKPVWEDKTGACPSCCWSSIKPKSFVLDNEAKEGGGGDVGKSLRRKVRLEDKDGGEASGGDIEKLIDDTDSAIEAVEAEWENAMLEMRIRKGEEMDASTEEEWRRKEVAVEEKASRARKGSVGMGGRGEGRNEKGGGKMRDGEKVKLVSDTVGQDRSRRMRREERRGNEVVVTERLSREEQRRRKIVGEMVGRKNIVGAWNLLRGESPDGGR